ncbi:hypothetical protein PVAP13_2NG007664 [Panicum virgatum]|uniref:Uncharacterized protein n=1 Tax=Panicum virgatum TaxID=38727 RepID=A0A8T0VD94_PANVG|nr:hypothetical protein PVAP13_2NG007664 [Panicum virgatum]
MEHVGVGAPFVPSLLSLRPRLLRLHLPLRSVLLRLCLSFRPSLLPLLAMVFGEGRAAACALRSSSSVAPELRRPALRPLLLPPPVPFHGGGAGERLRGGETAGLARFGGLELGPWRRQPNLAASTSGYSGVDTLLELCGSPIWRALLRPFLAGGHGECPHGAMAGSRSPARGAVERRRRLL